MFCSTVIATVGRQTLSRAVNSVLNQTFAADDFEIIVVNDSGEPLPKANWQQSERVQLLNTNRCERSVARNTGAAVAKGRYLHFLDDDDWLAPDALQCLWHLAQSSDAKWLYGTSQLVNREGKYIIQLQHRLNGNCFLQTMAGEWIPLQASLIEAKTFFMAGGFNPLIAGPEDIDLLRRITLRADVSGTSAVVAYVVRGDEGSTTDYGHHPEISRWAREIVLNSPGVFSRMLISADSSYWHGRILRAYLTSVVWNLQHKKLFTAASRATFVAAAFILAGWYVFSPNFWQAITSPYVSKTFLEGFRDANCFVDNAEAQ